MMPKVAKSISRYHSGFAAIASAHNLASHVAIAATAKAMPAHR